MRLFNCPNCQSRLFFDNLACVNCGHQVAFDSTSLSMRSYAPEEACGNRQRIACNWVVEAPGATL